MHLRKSRSDSHGREGAHLTTILLVGTASVGRIGSVRVQSNRDGLGAIDADDVEDQELLDRVEAVGELDGVFFAMGQSLRWGLGSDLTIDILVGVSSRDGEGLHIHRDGSGILLVEVGVREGEGNECLGVGLAGDKVADGHILNGSLCGRGHGGAGSEEDRSNGSGLHSDGWVGWVEKN